MFEIKEIDKNQDNIIDLGELNDALKPDWFLSNEDNLKKVWELLKNDTLEGWIKELLDSLSVLMNQQIDLVFQKQNISQEDEILLSVWKHIFWGNSLYSDKIQQVDCLFKDLDVNKNVLDLSKTTLYWKENLERNKNRMDKLWITVDWENAYDLGKITPQWWENLERNKDRMGKLWITVDWKNAYDLSKITPQWWENLERNKNRMDKLWITIDWENAYFLGEITPQWWENLERNKERMDKLWITIDWKNAINLSKITPQRWENLERNKERMDNIWIMIDWKNASDLSKITPQWW
jgi:hypothetical protein